MHIVVCWAFPSTARGLGSCPSECLSAYVSLSPRYCPGATGTSSGHHVDVCPRTSHLNIK
jgi:hypothetical protein